jgi:hypothetical protein
VSRIFPGLEVFDAGLEVAAFGVGEGAAVLAQAHSEAKVFGDSLDRGLVGGGLAGVEVEPEVGIAGGGFGEDGLGRKLGVEGGFTTEDTEGTEYEQYPLW